MTHFISILEQNAVAFANSVAVKTKSSPPLTYRELNQRINQYANFLQEKYPNSTQKQPRIAIVYHRSLDMLLWMLAAWKVNASFMLIDSGDLQQAEEVKNKLDQIQPQLIVTATQFKNHPEFSGHSSFIYTDDADTKNIINSKETQFTFSCPPDNTEAYIIATSGSSTGVAKFVIINHTLEADSGLSALFDDISRLMQLGEGDMVLVNRAVNWDPNICLIGVGLYHGAAIYIAPPEQTRNLQSLLLDCINDKVNVMLVVPSEYIDLERESDLLEQMQKNNLRLIFTGEALKKNIVDCFKTVATGGIYNGYGPTEGPIGITATKVESSDNISIHREMKGRILAIVDSEGRASDNGELIWKAQGFGGYLGNTEETNNKIIRYQDKNWYRSGDLVEKNGEKLTYLGRADKQFKVMAILFNPEPIGPYLEKLFPGTEAHAMGVDSPFITTKIPAVFYKSKENVAVLKSAVEKKQKAPMIQFIRIENHEAFPRTSNGKSDEKALEKKYKEYVTRNIPKATDVKENLRKIWCVLAGIDEIMDENKSFYETKPSSIQFAGLKTAISQNKLIKKLININEIKDSLTFKQLVELASQTSRSDYVTYVDPEKIDYPVIIIDDGLLSADYRDIAPNSPIIIVRPSNPKDTPENKLLDAHKTIKQVGIEGPYFVVQVLGDDVYAWGYWRNLPSQFYFFDKVATLEGLQKVLVPAIENAIRNDIKNKLGIALPGIEGDLKKFKLDSGISLKDWTEWVLATGYIPLILNDPLNIEQQLISKGFFRKHLARFANANILIGVINTSYGMSVDLLGQIQALGIDPAKVSMLHPFLENTFFNSLNVPRQIRPQRRFDAIARFYNSERNETPLILFAPFTGEDVYEAFCKKLGRPCIVLISPSLAETEILPASVFESFQELAYFYAIVVNHYQPRGAINLAGWSFGGLMAIAVAQKLNSNTVHFKSRKINYVGIIDTTAPEYLSPKVLMERIKWIIKTYAIPHDEDDIKKMNSSDDEQVWKLLCDLAKKIPDPKRQEYVSKIIRICRQHYRFGFERLPMSNQIPYHLYCADDKEKSSEVLTYSIFTKPPQDRAKSLGWDLPYYSIRGTDHFTILESEGLKKAIIRDCKASKSSYVNVQETLKELIVYQLPGLLKQTENPKLLSMIENQSADEKKVVLKDNPNYLDIVSFPRTEEKEKLFYEKDREKKLMGLQLLSGFWNAYLSDPAKNALPIYIDLKAYPKDSLEEFFEKLNLSPTQPHCIDEMNIIFIIDNVEQVDEDDLLDSIQDSRVDINRHPVIWLCDKEHYQQHPILEKILKFGDITEYENTRRII